MHLEELCQLKVGPRAACILSKCCREQNRKGKAARERHVGFFPMDSYRITPKKARI